MKRFATCLLLATVFVMFSATVSLAAGQETAAPQKKELSKKKKAKKIAKADLLDINTATADQLKSLPGITDEIARKIIAGRPYARKNQLKQKGLISASTYQEIKARIVAKRVKK